MLAYNTCMSIATYLNCMLTNMPYCRRVLEFFYTLKLHFKVVWVTLQFKVWWKGYQNLIKTIVFKISKFSEKAFIKCVQKDKTLNHWMIRTRKPHSNSVPFTWLSEKNYYHYKWNLSIIGYFHCCNRKEEQQIMEVSLSHLEECIINWNYTWYFCITIRKFNYSYQFKQLILNRWLPKKKTWCSFDMHSQQANTDSERES